MAQEFRNILNNLDQELVSSIPDNIKNRIHMYRNYNRMIGLAESALARMQEQINGTVSEEELLDWEELEQFEMILNLPDPGIDNVLEIYKKLAAAQRKIDLNPVPTTNVTNEVREVVTGKQDDK